MKRRTILVLLALVVLVLGSSYASAFSGTLWAGKNENAGKFNILSTTSGLIITIIPQNGWKITESHVAVHFRWDNIPQNKKGNPIPGHFTWGQKSAPPTTTHEYTISFSEIEGWVSPGEYWLVIAIHAVVVKTDSSGCILQEETAWGGPCDESWSPGEPLPSYPVAFWKIGTNRWGYYFELEVTVL